MTEFEKMRSRLPYNFCDPEVLASVHRANDLCLRMNQMTMHSPGYRQLLQEMLPGVPDSTMVCPPFRIDHPSGIDIGPDTFINYGTSMLNGGRITIGAHVKIGPNCQLLTPQHPLDWRERSNPVETCLPVSIGDNTWLGAGVIVCPGVSIGARCIIGAGSVVTRDIPDDTMAAGNPATVKKRLA